MADGYVQVATDGPGKKIDSSELTRADGTVVERQRVSLAGDDDPQHAAAINSRGEVSTQADFTPVVIQLKRIAMLLEILVGQSVHERDIK